MATTFTQNWLNVMSSLCGATSRNYLIGIDGKGSMTNWSNASFQNNTYKASSNYPEQWDGVIKNTLVLFVGQGTTKTINRPLNLEDSIKTLTMGNIQISNNQIPGNSVTPIPSSANVSDIFISITGEFLNDTDDDVTITELGVFLAGGGSLIPMLIREYLDQPITIKAHESKIITYNIGG